MSTVTMQSATEIQTSAAWSRLEASPIWAGLTLSQKSFVVVYIASGDATEGVRFSYKMKDAETAKRFSYELLKTPKIKAALAAAQGKSESAFEREHLHNERKRLLAQIDRQLLAAESGGIAAQRLLSTRASVLREIADNLTPELLGAKIKVGDIVRIDGVARRVLELDEDGRPSEVSDEAIQ